jgi:threonine dehydrogenase-like Zn-dependent dehydrogenase
MKALRTVSGDLRVSEVPVPNDPNEAFVRVVKSGICNTDLEIIRGYAGFDGTIGHEFVGIVESAARASELVGKRVVGEINVGCGNCSLCLSGDSRHCENRTVLGIKGRDGCHAEFLQLPVRNLIVVPENVSNDQAVFAEPLAAAYGITEQVEILRETRVAVVGDGKLGILCAMSLAAVSDNVLLIGKHRSKLAVAERHGIETVLLESMNSGFTKRFEVVVEASGSESGFATAVDVVKPRGKIVLKSTFHGRPTWEAWRIVVDEITIVGSRCGRMAPALDLLAGGMIDVSGLISDEFKLTDGVRAVDRAAESGTLKVILNMEA